MSRRWSSGVLFALSLCGLGVADAPEVTVTTWARPRPVERPVAAPPPPAAAGSIAMDALTIEDRPDGDMPRAVAYTPSGAQFIVVNRDTDNVTFHAANSGAALATVGVGDFPVDVAVSASANVAVVPNVLDDSVSLIDLTTQAVTATIPVGGVQPYRVRVTADGARAVVGLINDGVASAFSIIDLATATEVAVVPTGGQGVIGFIGAVEGGVAKNLFTDFAVSSGGIAVQYDRAADTVYLVDVATATLLDTVLTPAGPDSVAVSADGAFAVVGCETDNTLAKIDLATQTLTDLFPLPALNDRLLTITADGAFAVCFIDTDISFVDLTTGAVTASIPHGSFVRYDFAQTFDGAYLFVGSAQGRLIDVATQSLVQTLVFDPTYEVATSPVARRAIGLNNVLGENLHRYDLDGPSGSVLGRVGAGEPAEGDVPFTVDIAAGGAVAVVGNLYSGNVTVLDLVTGTPRAWIPCGDRLKEVRISPDGHWALACAADSSLAVVIDLQTDTAVASLPISTRPGHVRFSPDSSMAYVLNIAGTDRVSFIDIDGASSSIVAQLSAGQTGAANGPTFTEWSGIELSPDGSILAVCDSFNDQLRLYDTGSQTQVAAVPTGDFPLRVAFAPDGARAYVTNHFGFSVTAIDIAGAASAPAGTVSGVDAYPLTINVSPDGAYAYAGSRASGGTGLDAVRVIDTTSLTVVANVPLTSGSPRDARMATDGTLYVAATGSVLLRIDATGPTSVVLDELPLAASPRELAFDDSTKTALVAMPAVDAVDRIVFPGGTAPCPEDISGNGSVDFADLLLVLTAWGTNDPDADLDGNGSVGFEDLLAVLTAWGDC